MANSKSKPNHSRSLSPILICIIWLVLFVWLVMTDQWTKSLAVRYLMNKDSIVLIRGVLELQYLENRGSAFSMLQGQQWFFYILTAVFLVFAAWFFVRVPKNRRFLPLTICAVVLAGGAVGNFIDRLRHQYVVDFIYFSLIDFPIFNFADICITLSVIFLLILILFYYKDEDFAFIHPRKKAA